MTGTGPLLYLDVDGPLNLGWWTSPERFGELRAAGWHAGRVTGDPTGHHEGFRVVLDPGWGPALLGLAELGAELVWATGWNDAANLHIGPLLGLPRLQVAPAAHGAKASTVIPWGGLRPWAWLEDTEAELEAAAVLTPPGVPRLPVLVDRETGLTREHVDRVAAWLRSLSDCGTAAGRPRPGNRDAPGRPARGPAGDAPTARGTAPAAPAADTIADHSRPLVCSRLGDTWTRSGPGKKAP